MKNVLFICLMLLCTVTFAQTSGPKIGSVRGKILDKETQEYIPYATIAIQNQSKEIITGGITNDQGEFSIKSIPTGNYTLKVQFIGYEEYQKEIVISKDNKAVTLETISIQEDAQQLEEVEVIAERSTIEQKIDRKVINVGKDLVSAGATAGEIMNNIPSVNVDQQTNEISLRGNSNVRVLIDGKPINIDPSQLLQQIPSASIKQVELITNPSAKYNPEGMSGIINIVLHKNSRMGFNGSINQGLTFGITPKYNGSLDLNYRVGKVNVYGNYGFNTGRQANEGYINSNETGFENRQNFDFGNDNTSHLVKTGIDFYLNDHNTISFCTTQNLFYGDGTGVTDVNFL
ncbi:MAG: TonB-dependent receptor [Flavobacteriaceae bacterium]|nr:TonB-dependent receptor [Flavobacteriaceae bacterium]